jgi:hypothetical protein
MISVNFCLSVDENILLKARVCRHFKPTLYDCSLLAFMLQICVNCNKRSLHVFVRSDFSVFKQLDITLITVIHRMASFGPGLL